MFECQEMSVDEWKAWFLDNFSSDGASSGIDVSRERAGRNLSLRLSVSLNCAKPKPEHKPDTMLEPKPKAERLLQHHPHFIPNSNTGSDHIAKPEPNPNPNSNIATITRTLTLTLY